MEGMNRYLREQSSSSFFLKTEDDLTSAAARSLGNANDLRRALMPSLLAAMREEESLEGLFPLTFSPGERSGNRWSLEKYVRSICLTSEAGSSQYPLSCLTWNASMDILLPPLPVDLVEYEEKADSAERLPLFLLSALALREAVCDCPDTFSDSRLAAVLSFLRGLEARGEVIVLQRHKRTFVPWYGRNSHSCRPVQSSRQKRFLRNAHADLDMTLGDEARRFLSALSFHVQKDASPVALIEGLCSLSVKDLNFMRKVLRQRAKTQRRLQRKRTHSCLEAEERESEECCAHLETIQAGLQLGGELAQEVQSLEHQPPSESMQTLQQSARLIREVLGLEDKQSTGTLVRRRLNVLLDPGASLASLTSRILSENGDLTDFKVSCFFKCSSVWSAWKASLPASVEFWAPLRHLL